MKDLFIQKKGNEKEKTEMESYERFFFQAEDSIRDLVRSRGRGDVYKGQQQP